MINSDPNVSITVIEQLANTIMLLDESDEEFQSFFFREALYARLSCSISDLVESLPPSDMCIPRLVRVFLTIGTVGSAYRAIIALAKYFARSDSEDAIDALRIGLLNCHHRNAYALVKIIDESFMQIFLPEVALLAKVAPGSRNSSLSLRVAAMSTVDRLKMQSSNQCSD